MEVFIYPLKVPSSGNGIVLENSIPSIVSYRKNKFIFLNLSYSFDNEIDWNFFEYGKLWLYNLTYFECLNQAEMSRTVGLELINDYIEQGVSIKDGFEPFPISLRGINWIKFLSKHQIQDQIINDSLYAQYLILLDNLEYHLMGNHLLENAFSLLFGAYYFQDKKFYIKAKEILIEELEEQILEDGAHFELTPMYHQIMLFRVLDCINLVKNNAWKKKELLELLTQKARIMLGWLNTMTYENGNIPLLNDSANNVAPKTKVLNTYAERLNVTEKQMKLGKSGYRKIRQEKYEMIVDIGNIGPDYIPGHAHSDTFNFEIYIQNNPFIVDTGISTYEANEQRMTERSTSSHNTVEIDGLNQSEVWSSFRVANRAYVIELEEKQNYIRAVHDGYKKRLDSLHQREFLYEETNIKIIDTIISEKEHIAIARIHFYPGITPTITYDGLEIDNIKINIDHCRSNLEKSTFKIKEYNYASEFNRLKKAKMVEISFTKNLEIEIIL